MGQGRGERRKRTSLVFSFHPPPPGFLVGHLFSFRATLLLTFTNHKRKTPGILAGGVPPGSQNPDLISDKKNVIFRTRFQIWPLKSIPVFRPGGDHKMLHKH